MSVDAPAGRPRAPFKRAFLPKLPPEQSRRQGDVARESWAVLGSREAVMAFLNNHHDALGGRPLDLALDSDAGLERVRAVLSAQPVRPIPMEEPA